MTPYQLKYFPWMFRTVTGLDPVTGEFSPVQTTWGVFCCSLTLVTTVCRFITEDVPTDIAFDKFNNIPILILTLANSLVFILKRKQIKLIIELLLKPCQESKETEGSQRVVEKYNKLVNRFGAVIVYNNFLIHSCLLIGFAPLWTALNMPTSTRIQDLPLSFGWIWFHTDSYVVYAVFYLISYTASVFVGGLYTVWYLPMVYAALKISTSLRILSFKMAHLNRWLDERRENCLQNYAGGDGEDDGLVREEMIAKMEQHRVREVTAQFVEGHVDIMRFVRLVNNCFSVSVLIFNQLAALIAALVIPNLTKEKNLKIVDFLYRGNMVFGAFFSVSVFCYSGQIIIDESFNLHRVLYDCDWWEKTKCFSDNLLIMMTVTQKPLTLSAGGVYPLSQRALTKIVEAAYSYINLLLTLQNRI